MNRRAQIGLWIVAAALAAGCAGEKRAGARQEQVVKSEIQAEELGVQVSRLRGRVAELEGQLQTLEMLGDKRLDVLFHPHRLEVGKQSAGFDADGQAGDDGVRVYVSPIDEQGATLKAAGDVRVELYDLAAPPGEQYLGACTYGAAELGKYWFGGPFIHRFIFECRWPDRPPTHPEVTVRVSFVDYLTGRTLSGQTVARVNPPATTTE